MNTETFWAMIETARQQSGQNLDKQLEILIEELTHLSLGDILDFDSILWGMIDHAYRADVWEAAYLTACWCSDDGFHDFRGWLIAQGQTIYESVLNDPDDLSDFVHKENRLEIFHGGMTSVAEYAYEKKTGQEIPRETHSSTDEVVRHELVGGPLIPESEMPAKFPRIYAKLGSCDDVVW